MKKQTVQASIDLASFAGGAFAEKLNEALMQVAENIQNPNTDATTKRQIQIVLKFAPNKTRQLVSTQIAVTTKLAATEAIDTQMIMGVNMRTGQIEIAEYDGRIKGQMTLDAYQELTAAQAPAAEPAQTAAVQAPAAAAYSPEAAAEQPPTGKPLDLKNRNKPAENNGDPAGALAAGNDFDPETGEILDGAANEAQNKIVPIGSKAANA